MITATFLFLYLCGVALIHSLTGGNPVPVVIVTRVKVVGLDSDEGVILVTPAQGHALGQASDPGQNEREDEWMRSIERRKYVWIYKV
jgi:hypothetical protein